MGPICTKLLLNAFNWRGTMRRIEMLVLCGMIALVQVPALYLLILATGHRSVFSTLFNAVIFAECIAMIILGCATVRRVRDAGGAPIIVAGLVISGGVLALCELALIIELSWSASKANLIHTLALWSCTGFGVCVLTLLGMPTLDKRSYEAALFDSEDGPSVHRDY